ncbi:two-component regulator propeller domain-containing protein, partial [Xanthomonas vasicola]|uniref:two-component regulator propeller domain-containing protein n=1 Tax=Xanthomonas vasicola TaxID=56459 RepID=UPI001C83A309
YSIKKILFDRKVENRIYLLTRQSGVFVLEAGKSSLFFKDNKIDSYYSIEQDNRGSVWIGSEKGAYMVNQQGAVTSFNSENGLSDNQVDEIFSDAEHNVWVSCFSDGIYKYEGDAYIRYDKFKGQNLSYP